MASSDKSCSYFSLTSTINSVAFLSKCFYVVGQHIEIHSDFEIRIFNIPIQIFIFQKIRAKAGKSGVSGHRGNFKKIAGTPGKSASPIHRLFLKKYFQKTGIIRSLNPWRVFYRKYGRKTLFDFVYMYFSSAFFL
jgi:hypothetical protein